MVHPSEPVQAVLVAEVAGSVRLREKLGSEEALWAVDRCIKRMERSAEASRGRIARRVGCELMAAFESMDDALRAATEMQHRIAGLPPVSGLKLEIRIGLAHGSVEYSDGECSGEAPRLAACLAELAEPGETLTDSCSQAQLSESLKALTRDHGAFPAKSQFSQRRICKVGFPRMSDPSLADLHAPVEEKQLGLRLVLRHGGTMVVLDDSKAMVRIGRDADNDVVVQGDRVSRHHAMIEKQGDEFLFTDHSTNGSYLTPEGMPEVPVRRKECIILGKGIISFAGSATTTDAVYADYELLR